MTELPRGPGALIDRNRPVSFSFDGRPLVGYHGDSLASALLGNGVGVVGRSFRLRRPRGVFAIGAEDPTAWLTVDGIPSVRAGQITLREGLDVRSQNAWPSPDFDLTALLGRATAWLPPGFYYKTFKWPKFSWYEPIIRSIAGRGRVPAVADATRYEHRHAAVDVLVIGAGRSGRAAAASHRDSKMLHVDDRFDSVRADRNMRSATTALAIYDDNLALLAQREGPDFRRLWWVRAEKIVLATGAAERSLLFRNNDRPGVMLASAALTLANDYGLTPGNKVAVFTNNESGADVAHTLSRRGINVVGLIDVRPNRSVLDSVTPLYAGWEVKDTTGRGRLEAISIGPVGAAPQRDVECDALLVAGGWNPRLQLFAQAGGGLRFDESLRSFIPDPARTPSGITVTGRASGAGLPAVAHRIVPIDRRVFVDLAHDVTTKDLQIAVDEGFDSVELAKRWTSAGMAPDQGKTGNVDTILTLAQIRGVSPDVIGTTKFRPPYEPVRIGAMAGPNRGPLARLIRQLPLHDWHAAQCGAMGDYSGWWRPAVYARPGESESAAIAREVIHTRSRVGIFDGSSLTKILVTGADATQFLQRIYANGMGGLAPGRVRYGLMLNDEGIVRDDGVLARLSQNRYLVSASSAGGAERYRTMDRLLHVDWTDLDVVIDLVTTQWCTLAVCGPHAAEVIARVFPRVDVKGLPHMSVCETRFEDRAVVLMRVSFTGEASFEVSIGASHGVKLLTAVWQEGRRHRIAPFGLEALDVMRLEKGHFEVGVDTDVDTSPIDIGWGASLAKKKTDFIGRRSLELAAFADRGRNQLVGLESQRVLPVGSTLIDAQRKVEGHVTSSAWSPTLQRPIALALLADGRERMGQRSTVVVESRDVAATVASPRFFDPDDSRLTG